MANSRSGLYDDPRVYDILHAPGTCAEVDGLEAIERRFVRPSRPRASRVWLEPACGSGRYLAEAMRRGIDAVGFDISASMVEFARGRAAGPGRGEFFVGDMTDFAGRVGRGRVTFAFNLINTIRHLPSDEAMLSHFRHMARAMAPGAVYVVGLSLTAYGAESPSEDVWVGSRGRTRVTQVVQFIPPRWEGNPRSRREQVISSLRIESGARADHRDSAYGLRTYNLAQWQTLVGRSDLRITASIDECGDAHPAADGGYSLFVLRTASALEESLGRRAKRR